MTSLYKSVRLDSQLAEENNDCSVVALAIATNRPYGIARRALQAAGRQPCEGASARVMHKALDAMGFEMWRIHGDEGRQCALPEDWAKTFKGKDCLRQYNGSKFTASTVGRAARKGRFLAITRNHAIAVVDGQVEDWTAGRRHQIVGLWQIVEK